MGCGCKERTEKIKKFFSPKKAKYEGLVAEREAAKMLIMLLERRLERDRDRADVAVALSEVRRLNGRFEWMAGSSPDSPP